jgi:hypothetical protein
VASNNPYNPPLSQELVIQDGANSFSFSWYRWFASVVAQALLGPVSSPAPASAASAGSAGQIATDGTYLYVCVANNSWKRAALNAF